MKNKKINFTFLITIGILLSSLFVSCGNFHSETDIKNVGLPEHVSHIEFYNGGTMIREYDNASIKIIVEQNHYSSGFSVKPDSNITFYTYVVKCNGVEECIVDSESLGIVYRE